MISARGLMFLGFSPDKDFIMETDADGAYIAQWRSSSDRPTTADMEAAHNQWQSQRVSEVAAKKDRLVSVKSKLEALGLTTEEIQDAFGL